MNFRPAKRNEAKEIADCLILAMEDIVYTFIGQSDRDEGKRFLTHFISQPNNQYSYENCWVLEENSQIIGALLAYNGGLLPKLRKPVLEYLFTHYKYANIPQDETEEGEFYIDSFGVVKEYQGKGLGTQLLLSWINDYKSTGTLPIGLLVDEENPRARKLYEKLGFIYKKEVEFVGRKLFHYQMKLD